MENQDVTELLVEWSAQFMQATMQEFNRFARASGMSVLQLTVLNALYHSGPHEVTAFAEIMQVSPAGASQMIERLVQGGMVERRAATDRRVREVHLTDAGRAVVEKGLALRQEGLEALSAALPANKRSLVAEALALLIKETTRLGAMANPMGDPALDRCAGMTH
jgi:DNA-binding MarR family transcriptional regulator